jgi:lipid-binding SYLF domain-containing protein
MNRIQTGALGLVVTGLLFAAAPAWADLQADIDQAVDTLGRMPAEAIPASVLENAHGIAIVTGLKAAATFGIRGGKGVVVARTPGGGWSGPSGVGGGGLSFGFQVGIKVTRLVFVLNTPAAVEAFAKGNATLGVDLSVAFFPWGRTATGALTPQAAVYAYGDSEGLFIGLSGDVGGIGVREKDNTIFYGKPVPAMSILRGEVAAPPGAAKLQEALSKL